MTLNTLLMNTSSLFRPLFICLLPTVTPPSFLLPANATIKPEGWDCSTNDSQGSTDFPESPRSYSWVSSKPIFRPATPGPGSSPSSPSFSIPPLESCSSDSDDKAFQDASSNLLPIEEGGLSSNEAEADSEDNGVSVWEGMCSGGVSEDSL